MRERVRHGNKNVPGLEQNRSWACDGNGSLKNIYLLFHSLRLCGMERCNVERKGGGTRRVCPSPASPRGLCSAELGPDFAAGGGDKAGNTEQKSRGGRGRSMGRQRLLSTADLPHTPPPPAPEGESREKLGGKRGAVRALVGGWEAARGSQGASR